MGKRRRRFSTDYLDQEDPFEIDAVNEPHLVKHGYCTDDLYDVWASDWRIYPAKEVGAADWMLIGRIPGGDVLSVPLAPPDSGNHLKCRPIGIYQASLNETMMYEQDLNETRTKTRPQRRKRWFSR